MARSKAGSPPNSPVTHSSSVFLSGSPMLSVMTHVKCHGLLITMATCAGREGMGNLEWFCPHMARRPVMNESRKLELSKEIVRCLDDQELTVVAGGSLH